MKPLRVAIDALQQSLYRRVPPRGRGDREQCAAACFGRVAQCRAARTCQELKGAGKAFGGRRLPAHHQAVLRKVRSNDGCTDGNERHEMHCLSLLRLCAAEKAPMRKEARQQDQAGRFH